MSDPKRDPKSDAKADARTGEVRSESWIEAGLVEIARSGVEGVRVEVLAKNLGVTKGGFYRRFCGPAALLGGQLPKWSGGGGGPAPKKKQPPRAPPPPRAPGGRSPVCPRVSERAT